MSETWEDGKGRRYISVDGRGGLPGKSAVLELIRRYSIWGLCHSDGCECCYFAIHAYQIDVSCRKSEHCVRVSSHYLGHDASDGIDIAIEVLSQLSAPWRYAVRFCEYSYDHVNSRQNGAWVRAQKCCYCDATRPDTAAYLCDKCKSVANALHSYPLSIVGFQNPFSDPDEATDGNQAATQLTADAAMGTKCKRKNLAIR